MHRRESRRRMNTVAPSGRTNLKRMFRIKVDCSYMDGTSRDHPIDRVLLPVFLADEYPWQRLPSPTQRRVTVETVTHLQHTEPHHLYMAGILIPWGPRVKSYFCKLRSPYIQQLMYAALTWKKGYVDKLIRPERRSW